MILRSVLDLSIDMESRQPNRVVLLWRYDCCHNGLCLNCGNEWLLQRKKDQRGCNNKRKDRSGMSLNKETIPQRIVGKEVDLLLERALSADDVKQYVPSYEFAIVLHGTETKIGGICLRLGNNRNTFYGGHIGYGVDQPYRGHSYARKACLLLKPVARSHGLSELAITCNPDNLPSRRTCERLGLEMESAVNLPEDNEMYQEGDRQKCRYVWRLEPNII